MLGFELFPFLGKKVLANIRERGDIMCRIYHEEHGYRVKSLSCHDLNDNGFLIDPTCINGVEFVQ
jgi:hypothetical protein